MSGPERPAPDPAALARILRQRIELGAPPVFLEGLDREAALELVAAGLRLRTLAPRPSDGPVARGSAPTAQGRRPAAAAPPSTGTTAPPDEAPAPVASPVQATASGEPASRGAGGVDPSDADAGALEAMVLACTRCGLHETRTRAVYADGAVDARVMVVGEAPGANEDRTGRPFVGAAGKLLDLMLAAVDLSREDSVYICNVIKCRPPGNRNPTPHEIDTCSPYLRRQIELVGPEVILAVGTFAAQFLTDRRDAALGSLRGTVHAYEGVPLVVTYHPAALLRNRGWSRPTWDDLQLLRTVLEGG